MREHSCISQESVGLHVIETLLQRLNQVAGYFSHVIRSPEVGNPELTELLKEVRRDPGPFLAHGPHPQMCCVPFRKKWGRVSVASSVKWEQAHCLPREPFYDSPTNSVLNKHCSSGITTFVARLFHVPEISHVGLNSTHTHCS